MLPKPEVEAGGELRWPRAATEAIYLFESNVGVMQ
jgi:hypothetical protein